MFSRSGASDTIHESGIYPDKGDLILGLRIDWRALRFRQQNNNLVISQLGTTGSG